MPHVRKTIRSTAKTVLEAALGTVDYTILSARKTILNHDPNKYLIDMTVSGDQRSPDFVMGSINPAREHTANLVIRISGSSNEDTIEDDLDDVANLVEAAIDDHDWTGVLIEHPELMETAPSSTAEGSNVIASLLLRFEVKYRMARGIASATIN